MGVRVGSAVALLACAFAFLGSAGASPTPPPEGGKKLGIIHKRGSTGAKRAASRPGFDGLPVRPDLQLTNHGGVVMKTQKVYLIFWAPSGFSYPAGYVSGVEQWAQDVAADHGKTSNAYGTIPQYGASYTFAYGGAVTDTDSYPGSNCATGGGSICLTDQDLINEIATVQSGNGWTGGLVNQFALILPPGVDTCFTSTDDVCSYNEFCAYHSWYRYSNSSTPYVYLNLPYEVQFDTGCHTSDGATVQPEPNGDVDVLISPLSHEEREAATDPTQQGWYDAAGYEADDKCFVTWGPNIGETGGSVGYNQLINGNPYEAQNEWSNALHGCYQVGAPTVANLSTTSALAGASIGITGTNFFAADGSTPTVKFNAGGTSTVASSGVTVDSPTHLTVIVPTGVHTGKVTVQGVGGTGTSTQSFGPIPAITSLTDTLGNSDAHDFTGTTLVVHGSGFFGVTSVKFNAVAGAFSTVAADGTSLRVVVPATAVTGEITVTTSAGGVSNQEGFTVKPRITSFTPLKSAGGTALTITGTGLAGTATVDFPGHSGVAVLGTPTTSAVKVVVPMDATLGTITTNNGTDSALSAASFTPLPVISSFTPADGAAGATNVTITGGELADATAVKFGTITTTFDPPTATSITAAVPSTFSSGKITVVTPEGMAVSTQTFFVTKAIGVTPAIAKAGVTLTITGQGLASATSVDFHGHPAVPVSGTPTATTVKVVVPNDATTGALTVNTPRANPTTPSFKPLPAITSLSIVDGGGGDPVHVTGTNLLGTSAVKFGTFPALSLSNVTATGFDTEPPNAPFSSGAVSITTPAGTASSTQIFQVTKLTGMTPTLATAGATVTITGQGLGDAVSVDFPNHAGVVPIRTATSLKVSVPSDAVAGHLIVNMPDGMTPATATFKPLPKITGFTVNPVQAGDIITITGTNLEPDGNPPSLIKVGTVTLPLGAINTQTAVTAVVPDSALTGLATMTTADGTATSPTTLKIRPTISVDPSPNEGKAGATVTLTGKTLKGTTSVKFGTAAGAFAVAADGLSLTVKVPAAATSGPIAVTNSGGSTSSTDFTVDPAIAAFTPTSAAVGATVTITGTGLAGATSVDFTSATGTVSATPISSSTPTAVKVAVPDGATNGHLTVHTASPATATSAASLTVTLTVASFSPLGGAAGTSVTITGAGFSTATVTDVKFNGLSVGGVGHFTVVSPTQITTTVPSGATSGKITVVRNTAPLGLLSATSFKVLSIGGLTPTSAHAGDDLEIDGTNLANTTLVTFAGSSVTAVPTSATATAVHVAVPGGAQTGAIKVTTSDFGDVTSTASFTMLAPSVDSFDASNSSTGTTVTITGAGFVGVTDVSFAGTPSIDYTVDSNTSITATVPAGAGTGKISVTTAAGTGQSGTSLVAHSNGAGQTYYETDAVDTYSSTDAIAAAKVWADGTLDAGVTCSGEAAVAMVTGSQAAVWVYGSGALQGHVFVNSTTTALCPANTDPAWH